MKRVSLAVAVLFALVGFSAPCSAQQYWPNMRDFNIPSNEDVQNARVKEALKQGKYRAEIQALRKMAVTKSATEAKDLDLQIESSLSNTIKDINLYVAKMQACAQNSMKDKSCRSGYSMAYIYEDINSFSPVAKELEQYLSTVRECRETLKERHLPVKVADNCKTVISNKTLGYSKIMELSFKNDDRDNFFHARNTLGRHFKAVAQQGATTVKEGNKSLPAPASSAR